MGVSKNRGTPKWMVYNGKPYQKGWFGGKTLYFWKHPYDGLWSINSHPETSRHLLLSMNSNHYECLFDRLEVFEQGKRIPCNPIQKNTARIIIKHIIHMYIYMIICVCMLIAFTMMLSMYFPNCFFHVFYQKPCIISWKIRMPTVSRPLGRSVSPFSDNNFTTIIVDEMPQTSAQYLTWPTLREIERCFLEPFFFQKKNCTSHDCKVKYLYSVNYLS